MVYVYLTNTGYKNGLWSERSTLTLHSVGTKVLRLLYLQRDNIQFIIVQQRDEIWRDVWPAFPEATLCLVLPERTTQHSISSIL